MLQRINVHRSVCCDDNSHTPARIHTYKASLHYSATSCAAPRSESSQSRCVFKGGAFSASSHLSCGWLLERYPAAFQSALFVLTFERALMFEDVRPLIKAALNRLR